MKLRLVVFFTEALSYPLSLLLRWRRKKEAVLHISYSVHIAYYTVQILRENGIRADYLAVEKSKSWSKYDLVYEHIGSPARKRLNEFLFFWKVVAQYPIIHSHFMITHTESGWELKFLKMMGRKVVVHFRGCEIRDREKNMALHPEVNICQVCDYNARICKGEVNRMRRALAAKYADYTIVTTPDMKDFVPAAEHVPFFTPPVEMPATVAATKKDTFRIVHVTNHPGIEGSPEIEAAVQSLRERGMRIDFVFLKGVDNDTVLREMQTADLSIGKMKMGYYANAQIESLHAGVPAVTWVRPEFVTEAIKNSGLILTDLGHLAETLAFYISNPDALEAKRRIAKQSAQELHNNSELAARYRRIYLSLREA